MFYDLSDTYKKRFYTISITLQDGNYLGHLFITEISARYGLDYRNLDLIDAFEEGAISSDCCFREDITQEKFHFTLYNGEQSLERNIEKNNIYSFVTGINIIDCQGYGGKQDKRKCIDCTKFQQGESSAKGMCVVKNKIVTRSQKRCGYDFVPIIGELE